MSTWLPELSGCAPGGAAIQTILECSMQQAVDVSNPTQYYHSARSPIHSYYRAWCGRTWWPRTASALPFLPTVEELFSAEALSKHTACAEQAYVPLHSNTAVSSCHSVTLTYLCWLFTVNTTCCNGDSSLHESNSLNELMSICEFKYECDTVYVAVTRVNVLLRVNSLTV